MTSPHLPDTGRLSKPVEAYQAGDGFALIFNPRGETYCFRADLAKELESKGWALVPPPVELDELPF